MDYILLSAVAPLVLLVALVISYDIACQWKVNLRERMKKLPHHLQLPDEVLANTRYIISKFHAAAHKLKCRMPHSLNVIPGVGRTNGEGIKQNWSEINPVASNTKEMRPRSRRDTLDDHFGHHNWRKYIGFGKHESTVMWVN
jgi:hypothetical protein